MNSTGAGGAESGSTSATASLERPRARQRSLGSGDLLRVCCVVVGVVAAYHYSIGSLAQTLALQTPLAYLGLVPLIALVLALLRSKPRPGEPEIHDRQLDYIVALPLLTVALTMLLLLPDRLSSLFWVWRVDLLSLPLFAAGLVALVFGVRAMWRIKAAFVFLLLAWPLPYTKVLDGLLSLSTSATTAGVRAALTVFPLAEPAGGDGSLFAVKHGTSRFILSVASACSGVNGMVGFLIVGTAFAFLVRGPRLLKTLWLVAGLILLWLLNVIRILVIFGAGKRWGEAVALDVFHPVIGLVAFAAGVLGMLALMPAFRLHVVRRPPRVATALDGAVPARTRAGVLALVLVLLVSATAATANAGFSRYEFLADALGRPRLTAFTSAPPSLGGWSLTLYDRYNHGKPFFGEKSTWLRYMYSYTAASPTDAHSLTPAAPVIVDVISTPSRQRLGAYGLEACYEFHDYKITHAERVSVSDGLNAKAISYYDKEAQRDWTTLHWEWPVHTSDGLRYERVVFMLTGAAKLRMGALPGAAASSAPKAGAPDVGASGTDAALPRLAAFLTGFARAAVDVQQGHGSVRGGS